MIIETLYSMSAGERLGLHCSELLEANPVSAP